MLLKYKLPYVILLTVFVIFSSWAGTSYADGISGNGKNIANHEKAEELTILEAAKKLKWELGAIVAGVAYLGLENWNWGSSNSFRFVSEGWFGADTGSAGADKLGHMYSSYLLNEVLTKRLIKKTDNKIQAARKSVLFSSSIMLGVEVFDGFSNDHGFSYEDLVLNSAGIGISYLKNTIPGLDEKLDLRIEYHPTEGHSDHPIIDYSGYTYSAALKLGGFKKLKQTPLKYIELQLGYHAEGFKENDKKYFAEKKTELYFGVGLNLSEVIFKPVKKATGMPFVDYADTFFRYYQAPGTYVSTTLNERKIPYK